MDPRQELEELRRLDELQAKADGAGDTFKQTAQSDTNLQNLGASIGGAMYAPYLGVKQMMGKATPEDVAQWKQSMAGLWSTPMGKVGTIAGGAAAAAPLALIPGAQTIPGAALGGLAYGAAQPVAEGDTRAGNAIEGMGGNVAGLGLGNALGNVASKMFSGKAAELASQKAISSVRDATLNEAKTAGYAIPPTQANPLAPGAINRLLEGFSGKLQTAQLAGIKNQGVTDSLAKQALGLPQDVPLTPATLQSVRKTAGAAYEQLKQFGPVQVDNEFTGALHSLTSEYRALVHDFPTQRNGAIDALVKDLDKPQFNSGSAVELVKRLRSDGYANIKAFDDPAKKALGQVQIGAQNAIEDLLDRNLVASGNADFLQVFRNARTTIAKAHTVENALEESTGKVVASKIGKEFAKGRPLTGELATIGKVAQAFPKAVQNVNTSMPGLSPLDAAVGLIAGGASGNPLLGLAGLARPVVRGGLLSKPYQSAMVHAPSYDIGLLGRGAKSAATSESTRKLLQSLGMSLPAIQ